MTTHDYLMTMNTVRIADLKARLSKHLRTVRGGRRPGGGAPRLHRVTLPPPLRRKLDVVALLLEERQHER